jgi:hypothetical protein
MSISIEEGEGERGASCLGEPCHFRGAITFIIYGRSLQNEILVPEPMLFRNRAL